MKHEDWREQDYGFKRPVNEGKVGGGTTNKPNNDGKIGGGSGKKDDEIKVI